MKYVRTYLTGDLGDEPNSVFINEMINEEENNGAELIDIKVTDYWLLLIFEKKN